MTSAPTSAPSTNGKSLARRLAIVGGPITRALSGRRWFPLYGVIHHVGRRTGRAYATPVVVRSGPGGVYVPLPFGERTDWYRNVVAAGRVRVTWKGHEIWLSDAAIVDRTSAGYAFNALMHHLMRAAGISRVVHFRVDR